MYQDNSSRANLYSAPRVSSAKLWIYLTTDQKAFTVRRGATRVGGFLLSAVTKCIGTFSVVIHPRFRRLGYGHKVMSLVFQAAKAEGFRTLRADVYADNDASLALLRKSGFRDFVWLEKNL